MGLNSFPYTTAAGNNTTNSGGAVLANVKNRSSLVYANVLQAGQQLPVPSSGTQFYVTFTSATIEIQPSGGTFAPYDAGTGLQLSDDNPFSQLQVRNPNAFSIVFQIFIGFNQFIDNRLVLFNQSQPNVVFPTYPLAGTAAIVNINDLSGGSFTDINGNKWLALQRAAVLIGNPDSATTILVQKKAAAGASGPSIIPVYPLTSVNLPISGDYCLNVGGGMINAIVSEIYQAIKQTVT